MTASQGQGRDQDLDGEALLPIAVAAASEAGRLLASWRGDERPEVVQTKSSPTDVVTAMDRRAEALITSRIRAHRPDDAVLGEEGGQTDGGTAASRVRWIVDPLDGTVNYLYGLPDWCVSIAAEVDGAVVAGVVEVPRRGETFTAVAGHGAWLRRGEARLALRCSAAVPLGQALIGTGFGYDAGRRQIQGEVVAALLPYVRDIRRAGSAAVDLCSVAAGRLDAFYERGLNYWDFAAGGLIAREAGATVGGLAGRPESTSLTVAAGPGLYQQLEALLSRLNPERDASRSQERDALQDRGRRLPAAPEPDASGVIGVARVRCPRTWQNSPPESGTTMALKALQPRSECALRMKGDGVTRWLPTTTARGRRTTT
ncbi:MAG TPA: inositol monophosphatase family protein [Streptosporangiaceae bacterium]|jgi:myo-inositol-1(or 4)-monophosphatase